MATSASQPWRLSQAANKKNGTCSVCHATRQLLFKDGTIHLHGKRSNPCQGSGKPPLGPQTQPLTLGQNTSASGSGQVPVVGSGPGALPHGSVVGGASQDTTQLDQLTWSPEQIGVIKHIPKSARPACASHLAGLLREITAHPKSVQNWTALFNWTRSILAVPARNGKKQNLTSLIKSRTSPSGSTEIRDSRQSSSDVIRKQPPKSLAKVVAAKLEDGNLKAAIRLLVSEDSFSAPSDATMASLQDKHPAASLDVLSLPIPETSRGAVTSEEAVKKAVSSFPAGSAGGPDGLSPLHLKVLVSNQIAGPDLLKALTGFVNMLLAGLCPASVAKCFFGGRLLALDKKAGGIRPIVIGFTLRRLASKLANSMGITKIMSYLSPRQVGVGVPGGCEAAIHAARRYLEDMPQDKVLIKLDFANAFNSLHRWDMLMAVRERMPEIYPFVFASYSVSSSLLFGSKVVLSNEGPQQGDPIGPLLFCNTIHPLLESLKSELTIGYLDDMTLAGDQTTVAEDVQHIMTEGARMGLLLNVSKCEIITHKQTVIMDPLLSSFLRVDLDNACLLGSPLSTGQALDIEWGERCKDMERAAHRLNDVGAQNALILLRASFGAPRVQHLLRSSLSWDHPGLARFDEVQRGALSSVANANLSDIQWIQATLPIKQGGLGLRRVASLALPSFLASSCGTGPLQEAMLVRCGRPADPQVAIQTREWSTRFGTIPSGTEASKQAAWDSPSISVDRSQIWSNLSSDREKAMFLAASAPHTGDWLNALPIATCGLHLDDEAVRVGVALRLGLHLCVPHDCRCGALVDAWGSHAMSCKHSSGRVIRHHSINDIVARSLTSAGVPLCKEPSGLFSDNAKRPDGLTLVPWRGGKAMAWDSTISATLADSYVKASSTLAGSAAESAASRKVVKYSDIRSDIEFQPLSFESLGTVSESTASFISQLGHRLSSVTGERKEEAFLWQRLSMCLQRFNAILLHQSFVEVEADPDE
jgi:hypothetical protein